MVPNVSASTARRSVPKLRQVDGGPGYYGRFSNALPSKPSYFPIGVWFESVLSQRDINLDKDVGLNTYVVLTANSNLRLLRKNGMKALLQQEEWQPSEAVVPQTAGWELDDEIDMEMGPDAGYAELLRIKRNLRGWTGACATTISARASCSGKRISRRAVSSTPSIFRRPTSIGSRTATFAGSAKAVASLPPGSGHCRAPSVAEHRTMGHR